MGSRGQTGRAAGRGTGVGHPCGQSRTARGHGTAGPGRPTRLWVLFRAPWGHVDGSWHDRLPRVGPALRMGPWQPPESRGSVGSAAGAISHPPGARGALSHRAPSSSFSRQPGSSEQPRHSSALESDASDGPWAGHQQEMPPDATRAPGLRHQAEPHVLPYGAETLPPDVRTPACLRRVGGPSRAPMCSAPT